MQAHQSSPNSKQTGEPSQAEIANLLALFTQQRYLEAHACADALLQRFPQHGFTWKALGAIHKKLGNLEAAIAALTKATALMPQDADVHYNLANSYSEQRQLTLAESCYLQALALQPKHVPAHYNLGKVYQALENADAALACYRTAISLQPGLIEAHSSLGSLLHSMGNIEEAEACLRQAAAMNPTDPQHQINLANLLATRGKPEEAETVYRQALRANPYPWQAHHHLADLLLSQKRLPEAETMYVQAVQLQPGYAPAWLQLGDCLFAQHRHQDAEISYREALRRDPDYAAAYIHLGIVQREQEQFTEAEQSYRHALRLKPESKEVHNNLGNVLRDLDQLAEAEACFHQALELDPTYTEAHNNLGLALKTAGRLEEARLALEKAIDIDPDFLEPMVGLGGLKTYRENDPHIALLEKHMASAHQMKPDAQIRFWFAIGKMYEDLQRYNESFSAYEKGNRLKFSTLTWEEEKEAAFIDRLKNIFTKEYFEKIKASGSIENHQPVSDKTSIFILGMPRSGTTLLEQILSTHSGVFGAGELSTMSEVIARAMPDGEYRHFPDGSADFTAEQWLQLGENYLQEVWKLAPDASHITDKMPANFLYIGMIHLMFPNAKIIHAMRNPMDSSFSCYSRLFNKNNLAYSYDLDALGRYCNRYLALMEHWHAVLPAGTILDCRYEDMVEDTENQARRVLEYIGLPWDERCLDFHKNKRRVKTASQTQVQKPIYKSSVERWKNYEKHLGLLAERINQA
jgi:tetratricopeptide (TPR) repeat protein